MNNSDKFSLILEKLQKIDVIDDKVTALDKKVTALDKKVTTIDARLTVVESDITKIKKSITAFDTRMTSVEKKVGKLYIRMENVEHSIKTLKKNQSNNQEKVHDNNIYFKLSELYPSNKIKLIDIDKFYDINSTEITELDGLILVTSKYPLYNVNMSTKNISHTELQNYKYSPNFVKTFKNSNMLNKIKNNKCNITIKNNRFNFHKVFLVESKRTFDKVKLDMKLKHVYLVEQILNNAKTIDLNNTTDKFREMFKDIPPYIFPDRVNLIISTDKMDNLLYNYIRDINKGVITEDVYNLYTYNLLIKDVTFGYIINDNKLHKDSKEQINIIKNMKESFDKYILNDVNNILDNSILQSDEYFMNRYYKHLKQFIVPYSEVSKYYKHIKHFLGIYVDNKLFIEGVIDEFN
jgi:hypothetical protein